MTGNSGAASLMPVIITVPIVVSCVLVAAGSALPRRVNDLLATGTAAAVTALGAAVLAGAARGRLVAWAGGWRPVHGLSVGIPLIADRLSAGLVVLIGGLAFCALLYSWRYVESASGRFHALMLLFVAGMSGFALSGDVFDMFVFFELMGAAAYALTGMKIEDKSAVQGGLTFGIINSLAAYLSLAGVAILYARTGQLGLPQLGRELSQHRPDALVVAAFVLILAGFMVKGAIVPFHFWVADAHAVAPAPACALFAGVMVELGLYGVARVYWTAFSGTLPAGDVRHAFLALGALTALVGAVMCVLQRHLKRLLAYSTIAHVGLFTMSFAALSPGGTAGAALYAAGHAAAAAALFLIAGVILDRYGTVDELRLYGAGRGERVLAALWFSAAFTLAGLPPFGIALGKSVAEEAVSAAGYPWGPALFIAVSALTGGAVLRAGARVCLGLGPRPDLSRAEPEETSGADEKRDTPALGRTPVTMMLAIMILIAAGLALGLLPQARAAFETAGQPFNDRAGYLAQALGQVAAVTRPVPAGGWTASGVAFGLLSVALAIMVAGLGLHSGRLPPAVRSALSPARPVLTGLHRLHSGHIGDYVAWLFAGITAVAALIGLPLL